MPRPTQVNSFKVELEFRGNIRRFFGIKDSEVILDGPAGTGKTLGILHRQHLIMNKYPRARGLIVRKFRSSMNETVLEVFNNEVRKDENGELYPDAPEWRERDQKYVYSNSSEIIVAGMDDPSKAMSSKYDWFYWNELIEGKRGEWEALMSRLRNFRVPFQQAIGDTNPGPPTHWINQMALANKLLRLPTTHKDNPAYWKANCRCPDSNHVCKGEWTAKGEAYINNILKKLTGIRSKRLYDGKWVAAEGQVYPMWDTKIHVIPRRTLPKSWPRYWVFDFGYIDPFVWVELVENPDTGQLIHHRELYHTQMRVEDAAKLIKEQSFGMIPYALVCDHDAENRATLEKELGFLTLPAFKSIHPGIQAVQLRLREDKKWSSGNAAIPGYVMMENANIKTDPELLYRHKPTCTQEEWESYCWDTSKISEDKYKDEPVDKDNHGMDCVRYGIGFVDSIAIDPQEREGIIHYNDIEYDQMQEHWADTEISPY